MDGIGTFGTIGIALIIIALIISRFKKKMYKEDRENFKGWFIIVGIIGFIAYLFPNIVTNRGSIGGLFLGVLFAFTIYFLFWLIFMKKKGE